MAQAQTAGTIVQCIGAVIDVEFARDSMPHIFDALQLDAEKSELTLEVSSSSAMVSCARSRSALPMGFARHEGNQYGFADFVPVGPKTLGRIMDVLGRPIDDAGPHRGRARDVDPS